MKHSELETKARPVVLILAAQEWFSTARLAMALAGMGCRVELVSPRSHPALSTSAVQRHYTYRPVKPVPALRAAFESSQPATVIAADEQMLLHLEELWDAEPEESDLRALLTRSLGSARAMACARSRIETARLAVDAGVDTPETLAMERPDDLSVAAEELGLPMVLKADMTFGGRGVRVVHETAQAVRLWRELREPPSLARAVWRGLRWKEWTHVRDAREHFVRGVCAQRFVTGSERTSMAVCSRGRVVASVVLEVMRNASTRGPSSMLRVVEDTAISCTMERVARAVGVTGFCGFDFMVDEASGKRLLIEMNPRPTQLVHLPLGVGKDLTAAYLREVVGVAAADREAATEHETVVPFPQEVQRDPESDVLRQVFHDVPWEEPRLVVRALGKVPQLLTADARWRG